MTDRSRSFAVVRQSHAGQLNVATLGVKYCNYVKYELRLLPTADIVSTCQRRMQVYIVREQQIEIAVTETGCISRLSRATRLFGRGNFPASTVTARECKSPPARAAGNSLPALQVSSLAF